jgi:MFS family permease
MIAILMKPLAQEFGWLRGDISMAYTVATVATAIAGVAFSRIADLHGVRVLALIGSITICACLLVLGRITALWQIYLLYAIYGAFGFAALSVPLIAAVANQFHHNRGTAVGIATAGGAVGQGLVPFVASAFMTDHGWRDTFGALGLAYLVIAVPLALLVRNRARANVSADAAGASAAGDETMPMEPHQSIMWICAAVIFCCICMAVPIVHLPALASDIGFTAERSAAALTILMFAGAAGRIVIGRVADRFGPLNAYLMASLGQTVFVFWFAQVSTLTSLYLLAAIFGLCFGGVMTSFLLTIRSLVPTRIAATAMSVVVLFGWLGMGLGAYFGGVLFDISANYSASFAMAAASGVVNIAIVIALSLRLRRVAPPAPAV